MLKMRLQRIGRKNDPSYRVIVCDSRQGPKSGKYIDQIGTYNPKMGRVQIDGEKVKVWIGKGVQVSGTVHNILVGEKVIEGKKVNVLPRKSPIVAEQKDEKADEKKQKVPADVAVEESGETETEETSGSEESKEAEAPSEETRPATPSTGAEADADEKEATEATK